MDRYSIASHDHDGQQRHKPIPGSQGTGTASCRRTPAFAAHKATTVEEVYAPGKWNSHLSDDVATFALAHNAADRQAPPAAGEGVPRTSYVSRSQRELTYGPGKTTLRAVGEVRMVEEEANPYVIS